MEVSQLAGFHEPGDQWTGADHPANPEAGEGDLGKAAEEDGVAGWVELLEGGERRAVVAELAVDVVFDQDGASAEDGLNDGLAVFEWQGLAGGVLEGRGQDDGPDAAALQKRTQAGGE